MGGKAMGSFTGARSRTSEDHRLGDRNHQRVWRGDKTGSFKGFWQDMAMQTMGGRAGAREPVLIKLLQYSGPEMVKSEAAEWRRAKRYDGKDRGVLRRHLELLVPVMEWMTVPPAQQGREGRKLSEIPTATCNLWVSGAGGIWGTLGK